MVYMVPVVCSVCNIQFAQAVGGSDRNVLGPKVCPSCMQRQEAEKRKAHFDMLDKLTITERLRRLEEWIYDHKPPVNIRDLKF